jgi:hypothetical protein
MAAKRHETLSTAVTFAHINQPSAVPALRQRDVAN